MKNLLRLWPILLLALWFGGVSVALDHAVRRFEDHTTSAPPAFDPSEPWRHARFFTDPDSYAWLSYARDLRASPHFRVRFTHRDNAPHGRPVHWSQPPVWSLCAISAVLEKAGLPPPLALELSGRALLPLVGFFVFSALWLYLRRRFSPAAAAFFAFAPAVVLFWDFHPFRPDHQAYQLAAAFFFVLPLLFSGFGFAPPGRRPSRLPFLLSGISAGFALWFGATVFFFTLAAATLASALALLPENSGGAPPDSAAWRVWGLSGAVASILFWLLEYAPNHFSMRLEANHPLYALSFLGIGECLYLLCRFRHDPATCLSPAFLAHAAMALAAAAALPLLLLFGPVAWYIPRSTFMLRLHARHINEFLPLATFSSETGHSFFVFFLLAVGPGLFGILLLLFRPSAFLSSPAARRRVTFALPFFFLFALCYVWQNRWKSQAIWASLLVLVALWSAAAPTRRPRLLAALILLPAVLQFAIFFHQTLYGLVATWRAEKIDPMFYGALKQRNFVLNWKKALGGTPVRALAPTGLAPLIHYFGLGDAIASLYWENLEGDLAATAAFADPAPDAPVGRRLAVDRRITHVLMLEGSQDALMFYNLQTGLLDQSGAARTLGGLLAGAFPGATLPSWLGVDPDLNIAGNPHCFTFIPSIGKWYEDSWPVRIYTVRPEVLTTTSALPPPGTPAPDGTLSNAPPPSSGTPSPAPPLPPA